MTFKYRLSTKGNGVYKLCPNGITLTGYVLDLLARGFKPSDIVIEVELREID